MFEITLTPIGCIGQTTQIAASGYTLTYNGEDIDFSILQNGQEVAAEYPAIGVIKKIDDVVHITLVYTYDTSTAEPDQTAMALTHTLVNETLVSPVSHKETVIYV